MLLDNNEYSELLADLTGVLAPRTANEPEAAP